VDFLELAKERYSVRKFDSRQIEEEKVNLILEAGRIAPTAVNYQPQRILALQAKEEMQKLEACTPYHFGQTLALLVCYDKTVSWKRKFDNKDSGEVDASIVATHMMLEAENLGIGSTWVGHFNPQALRESFAIPENLEPVLLLMLGYPSEDAEPNPLHFKRFDKAQTVFFGSFPNPV
jgi:nitroreductase